MPVAWRWPNLPPIRRFHMRDDPDLPGDVDWLTGAMILFRREALEGAGGFDEGFFMYSEELDLCRRLHAAGWRIRYEPSARARHHEARSSAQVPDERQLHFLRSRLRYFRKHHGRLAAAFLRWGILLQFAAQAALEAGKWLLGHERGLRRRRLRAHVALLRDGLGRTAREP
jgi:GT2 family glycosyltransferase